MSSNKAHGNPRDRKYPAQGLVRILKGSYPKLEKLSNSGRALDVGCGDGSNTEFLQSIGFDATGTEVDAESVALLNDLGIAGYVQARSSNLPFENNSFEVAVAWHSIYYLDDDHGSLKAHITELHRVLAIGGILILSIPKVSNFIFQNSEEHAFEETEMHGVGRRSIRSDPFGLRDGQVMATIEDIVDFKNALEVDFFMRVEVAEEVGDWFGFAYDWWVLVCVRSTI